MSGSHQPGSPLVPDAPVEVIETITRDELAAAWRRCLGIDIGDELAGVDSVALCRCERSGLLFFQPPAAGSARLYARLQAEEWYYRAGKWEYEYVSRLARPGNRVMDLGCGAGQFLEVAGRAGLDAEGLDFNDAAVRAAQARGLSARCTSWDEAARECPGAYDMVVSFQVLEHLSDPLCFLQSAVALTKEGGLLALAVPHGSGWLARTGTPLDHPPHHVLRWTEDAMRFLQELYPLSLERIVIEPLDRAHVRDYAGARIGPPRSIRDSGKRRPILLRILVRLCAAWVALPMIRSRLPGMTMIAVFRRVAAGSRGPGDGAHGATSL